MSQKVNLYESAYGNYESDTYRLVRIETYGEDLGQTSWVTTEESNDGAGAHVVTPVLPDPTPHNARGFCFITLGSKPPINGLL